MKVAVFIALVGLALAEDALQAVDAPAAKDDAWHGPKVPPGFKRHNSKRAATCGTQTVLTAAQAVESVTAHNTYRSQEPASDLRAMTWSDEMASVAQGYANKCIWAHGDLYDCEGNRLGQNLYVQSSSAGFPVFNMTGVAWNWWNERNDYTYTSMSCKTGAICGHFTQLAADQSYQVGCAYANCPTMNVAGATWNNCLLSSATTLPPATWPAPTCTRLARLVPSATLPVPVRASSASTTSAPRARPASIKRVSAEPPVRPVRTAGPSPS